jgi:hypothetical protein
MKKMLLVAILGFVLMLIATPIASAGEPPTDFTIGGPALIGTLTLEYQYYEDPYYYMTVTFRGWCKTEYVKKKYCFFQLTTPFNEITRESMLNYVLLYEGPPDCYSECGGEDIIITRVLKFKKTANKIVADVVFRFLIYAPE